MKPLPFVTFHSLDTPEARTLVELDLLENATVSFYLGNQIVQTRTLSPEDKDIFYKLTTQINKAHSKFLDILAAERKENQLTQPPTSPD